MNRTHDVLKCSHKKQSRGDFLENRRKSLGGNYLRMNYAMDESLVISRLPLGTGFSPCAPCVGHLLPLLLSLLAVLVSNSFALLSRFELRAVSKLGPAIEEPAT